MDKMKQVAVIGACGKMGRGIALLLLQEMTLQAIRDNPSSFHLALIDPNKASYYDLKSYLRSQLLRFAEKNINQLRESFTPREDLISNGDMICAFIETAMNLIDCSASLEDLKDSKFVFEAAFEDVVLKTNILKEIHDAWVFTNTSSIPIEELAKKTGLKDRLIGYHFYNPPAVQKLLEIIPSNETSDELKEFAIILGKKLGKTIVISSDVAGFIGNGHFAAEIIYAVTIVESLTPRYTIEEAVELVDRITRDFLLRPMGIFQLLDYVGLPIIGQILSVMHLKAPLIDLWQKEGLVGGQTPEGQPKNGIFRYNNGAADAVWSKNSYIPLSKKIPHNPPPFDFTWKKMQRNPELSRYFDALFALETEEGKIAQDYLKQSKKIVDELVSNKVAISKNDVGTVLKNGFFHLYSPDEVIK